MFPSDSSVQKPYFAGEVMSPDNTTFINTIFREQKDLITFLQAAGQPSYAQNVEVFLSKTLLLSCASYFESRISNAISDYTKRISNSDEALISLVRTKAIERQYHTYFQWREGNRSTAPFFAMFGTVLKDSAKKDLKESILSDASAAFLELGDLRNLLVHENFASYPLNKTSDEIFSLYETAEKFVTYVENKLNPKTM